MTYRGHMMPLKSSLFDAEYLWNGTRYRHSYNGGTYTRYTQGCHFEWPWVILSQLAKYSMTRSKHRAVSLRQLSCCALLLLLFSLCHINILICCLSFLTNKSFDRCMAHVKMARYESISDVAQMVPHKECCSNGVQCMVSGWPCQLRLTTPCPLVSRALHCRVATHHLRTCRTAHVQHAILRPTICSTRRCDHASFVCPVQLTRWMISTRFMATMCPA